MMKLLRYSFFVAAAALMVSCDDENENTGLGESINDFKLVSPANFSSLTLNPSTPNKTVNITWEAAKTGLGGTPTYQVLLDKKDGDFSTPLLSIDASSEGKATSASITYQQIKEAIASAGTTEFIWTVATTTQTTQGVNTKNAKNPFSLEIKIATVGIADFSYLGPNANQKLFLDKVRTPNEEVVFSWNPTTSTAGAVTYKLVASTSVDGFDEPVLEVPSDNGGTSTTATVTHADLVEFLSSIQYNDGLYWQVQATSGGTTHSPETRFVWFEIFDVPNLYIVGSFTNGWNNNCTDAIQLTNKGNGVFESLVAIPGGAEFKLILECGSWDVNWGSPTNDAITPSTDYAVVAPGNNIKVTTGASYFVRVDFSAGTFRLTQFNPPADMYLVGGSVAAGWNPGASAQFREPSANVFELYAYIETAGDGFKFLQQQDWPGDWGSKDGTRVVAGNGVITGELVQDGENNASVEANGFYRVTLNFNTLTYKIEPMTWGIIGSARTGDGGGWGAQDNMTFVGGKTSYKWTITTTLFNGELKFRANDDWGINFGDDGNNGTVEYNGANIPITAGTYTIELILAPGGYTYTIN